MYLLYYDILSLYYLYIVHLHSMIVLVRILGDVHFSRILIC